MSKELTERQLAEAAKVLDEREAEEDKEFAKELLAEELGLRKKTAVPRLNFEIPGEMLRGLKVAAALQDTTIKMTVIRVLDEWLRAHPDLSSYSYGEADE